MAGKPTPNQVKVQNLTPLDLWVRVEDSRRALRPFDQVVAVRPQDSKIGVEANGVLLGLLQAEARSADLNIRPEMLEGLNGRPEPAPGATASAILENRTNVDVKVVRLDRPGQPGLSFKLDKTGGYCKVSGLAGDIYIVRDAFRGDVLDMFVLGTEEPALDVAITSKFRAASAKPTAPQPLSESKIKIANRTPLDVCLEYWDGEKLRSLDLNSLKELEGQEQPPFGKFRAKVNGMRMGVLEVNPDTKQLTLDPSFFCSQPMVQSWWDPVARGSGSCVYVPDVRFLNSTNVAVDICCRKRKKDAIEEIEEEKKATLLKGGSWSDFLLSWPGAVYVIKDSRTDKVLAMHVLQGGSQELTITGNFRDLADEVQIRNSTPLELTVITDDGTEHLIPPFGTTKAMRPALGFALKHRGILVGSLMLDPKIKSATIEPSLLRTQPLGPFVTLHPQWWPVSNHPSFDFEVHRVSQSGQEEGLVLNCSSSMGSVKINAVMGTSGDVCVVREARTRELLDMVVLGSGSRPELTIASDFPARQAAFLADQAGPVEIVNLTSLELDVGCANSALKHLRPSERVSIERSPDRKLEMKHGGMRLGFLEVDFTVQELQIVPGLLQSVAVEIVNLTPLELDVGRANGTPKHLRPFERGWIERSPDRKFEVKHGGMHLRFLEVDLAVTELKIVPGLLQSAEIPGTGASGIVENQTDLHVDLFYVDTSGKEALSQTLEPNAGKLVGGGPQGRLFVARAAFTGNLLAMFVNGAPTIPKITMNFSEEMARRAFEVPAPPKLKAKIKTLYLIGEKRRKPDPRSRDYIVIADRQISRKGKEQFNTRKNVKTRAVTITGVELVWDAADNNYGLMSYQGENILDIEKLEIFADRVVIASPLWFPGTHVTIHARELEFQGNGQIKTTPIGYGSRRAQSPNGITPKYEGKSGLAGEPGGDLNLSVRTIRLPPGSGPELRFVTTGSAGQLAEVGGLKPYEPSRTEQRKDVPFGTDLNFITNFLKQKFTFAKHPVGWDWPEGFEIHGDRLLFRDNTWGNVVDLEIVACDDDWTSEDTNFFWLPSKRDQNCFPTNPGTEFHRRDGVNRPDRVFPDKGEDAYPGGYPGKGGPAGSITTSIELNPGLYCVKGGPAGPETPAVLGGPRGTPTPAYWVNMVIVKRTPSKARSRSPRIEYHEVTAKDGEPAPARKAVGGADGSVSVKALPWMAVEILDAVIACARDAYRNGHRDLACELLDPYYVALRSGGADLRALQSRVVVLEAMRANLLRNTDFYGNPPGWLPRLHLTTTFDILQKVRGVSAELLYFSQEMTEKYEKIEQYQSLAEKGTVAVQADIDQNMEYLQQAFKELDQVRDELREIEAKVTNKQGQIEQLKNWAEQKAKDKIKEQRIFRGVMKVVGGTIKMVPVGQPYIGLAGDVVSGVGDFDFTNPDNIPDQISKTFGKVGGLTNTFLEENKDLISADAVKPFSKKAKVAAGKTAQLTEQVRKANGAVANYETTMAKSQKKRVEAWQIAHKNELEELRSNEQELKEIEGAIQQLELKQSERERITNLLTKEYGQTLGTGAAEALLEERMLLTDAVAKTKTKLATEKEGVGKTQLQKVESKLERLKTKSSDLTEELAVAQYQETTASSELEDKKAAVDDTLIRLKKIGDGLSSVGAGVASLMSPVSSNDKDVQNLTELLLNSENKAEYEKLLKEAALLAEQEARMVAKFNRAQQQINTNVANIAMNLNELDALSHQRQLLDPVLDVRTKWYLKDMEWRARDLLRAAIYTFVMAYRYETLTDVRDQLYNLDALVSAIRKLKAVPANPVSADVSKGQLLWADFQDVDDKAFRNELLTLAMDMLSDRQKFAREAQNSFTVELPAEQRETLRQTGMLRMNFLSDFEVGLTFDHVQARIIGLEMKEIKVTLSKASKVQSLRLDFVHSGESIIKDKEGRYCFFRQAPEHDPISWGFSFDPRKDDAKAEKDNKDKDATEGNDELLSDFLTPQGKKELLKFREHYPALFSDVTLFLTAKEGTWNPLDVVAIPSFNFTVKYSIVGGRRS